MITLTILVLLFILFTSVSITILGYREFLSINFFTIDGLFYLLTNWRIYVAVFFAILARVTFTLINSHLYKMPQYSNNSTNISSFLSNTAIIGVLIFNYIFLSEILTLKHFLGMCFILIGIFLILIN